jgi:thiamine-phosphate pyrophosphorylase
MADRPLAGVAKAALAGGCRWILVREKDLACDELSALVQAIVRQAEPYGALVSVSGDADVAHETGAKGVHLPQSGTGASAIADARARLGPCALIGVSAHSIDEAATAARDGANYVTFSPIFLTASKPGYGPSLGVDGLAKAAARIAIPIVALAGIDASNVASCRDAGAAGVAVMGAVMRAKDPAAVMRAMIAAWNG